MRIPRPLLTCLLAAFLSCPVAAQDTMFVRGDSNIDSRIDISDPVRTLGVLFLGEPDPGCDDAMDSNDSGLLDISDGVYTLNFLFAGAADIPAPFPKCGTDPTADGLGCGGFQHCSQEACFDEAYLDATLAAKVPPVVCVPPDAAKVSFGTFEVTVCPSAAGETCPEGGDAGCTIDLNMVAGTYNAPAKRVQVHVEGSTTDFPVLIRDTLFGSSVTCLVDATFTGDAASVLTVDGTGTITAVGDPVFSNITPEIVHAGDGIVCNAFGAQEEQVEEQLVTLIEESAAGILDTVKPELIGRRLCVP